MYESIYHGKSPNIEKSYQLIDNIFKKCIEFKPRLVDKPLILYGKGNLGVMAKEYFKTINIPISNIIDKETSHTIPIEQRKLSLLSICVVNFPFSEIMSFLKEQGWNDIAPFYDISQSYIDRHPLNNGWYTKLEKEDIKNIKTILSKLEDDKSRAHYLQFIAWRILREEWIFKDSLIITDNRYFIPEILSILNDNETFVDIGAHHGEVSLKFIDIVNNKYNKIYAFEPDIYNYQIFEELEKHYNELNIILFALSSESGKKKFYEGLGYVSQMHENGNVLVNVEKLDNLYMEPTFIKIHTEGNEEDVIKGALNTIIKNRPILAITCYHNRNGLFQIQNTLISSISNYIFYFRLHSWCGTGAVIYAIPRERLKR